MHSVPKEHAEIKDRERHSQTTTRTAKGVETLTTQKRECVGGPLALSGISEVESGAARARGGANPDELGGCRSTDDKYTSDNTSQVPL